MEDFGFNVISDKDCLNFLILFLAAFTAKQNVMRIRELMVNHITSNMQNSHFVSGNRTLSFLGGIRLVQIIYR